MNTYCTNYQCSTRNNCKNAEPFTTDKRRLYGEGHGVFMCQDYKPKVKPCEKSH